MTRTKVLLAWSALLLGLSACDKTTDSAGKDTAPANITANLSSTELTAGGASVDVSVAASSDTGLVSIDYSVKDASGNLATNSFLPQFVSMPKIGDKTFASSGWKVSALSTAKAGSYVLILTLTEKSGAVSTKELAFTVKSGSSSGVAPVISGFGVDNANLSAGTLISTRGTVSFGTSSATVRYSVSGPSESSITLPASFTVNSSPANLSKQIAISSSAPSGLYTITVAVTDLNGKVASESTTFAIESSVVGEPFVNVGRVEAGAQSAAAGSFIELSGTDAGTVYTAGAGIPYRTIDVIFGADGSTASFMSPDYAATGAFSLSAWTTLNKTELVDMGTSKPANTGVVAQALDDRGTHAVAVVVGHYYGIGTKSGDIAMIFVSTVNGSGRSSTAGFDIYLVDGGAVIVDPVTPTNWPKLELGAQNAVQASALDLDGQIAYSSGAKTDAEVASIDLLFLASGSGVPTFYSPSEASLQGLGALTSWNTKNFTYIADAGVTPITTASQAELLSGSTNSQSAAAVVGHYYAVEIATGPYCAFKVESITGSGRNAVVSISMKTF
ncbi:MAG TPA: hypothetical protein PKO15_01025 [Fibrobacteria bacterium]|nr:hypothetical protein [Fibrobacteria bacterium]